MCYKSGKTGRAEKVDVANCGTWAIFPWRLRAIRLCTDLVGSFHDNRSRFTSRFLAAGFQGIAKLLLSLKPVVLIKPVGASALNIYLICAFANFRLGNLSTVCGYLCIFIVYFANM